MTTFDERKKGFEAKYKHDQETQFKVTARRNKLLGHWAAAKMGMTGSAAEEYAKEVVVADFTRAGDSDVIEKVVGDLTAKNIPVSEADIRQQLDALTKTARDQVMTESGKA